MKTDRVEQPNKDYRSVYLLVAAALFVVLSVIQGGVVSSVSQMANEFVNRMDSISIASGRDRGL